MEIVKISKRAIFNKTAIHPLQTWEWGEFRKQWGNKVVRLPFGQVIFSKIPKTRYTIGTFIKGPKPTKDILVALKKLAKEENAVFIKLEPNVAFGDSSMKQVESSKERKRLTQVLKEEGCVPGKTLFTPTSFWIDLTKSEEELMQSFSSKTRYNIRLAQRKGVKVKVVEDPTSPRLRGASNSDDAFEKYLKLMRETVERQGFFAHSEKYHRLMWQHLHQLPITNYQLHTRNASQKDVGEPIARLLTATYKGEIITTWIVFVWKDFLYYPYGASSSNTEYKSLMANNLMMWEAIRFGKKLGLKTFDLWGREVGKGFTKFKEGYNPQVVEFLGTWDLVTSPFYWPYRVAENLRWNLLRFKNKFVKPEF